MQHVDYDARQQQTDDHAEQRMHWPSLRGELGHVSCVRPPGGTPRRMDRCMGTKIDGGQEKSRNNRWLFIAPSAWLWCLCAVPVGRRSLVRCSCQSRCSSDTQSSLSSAQGLPAGHHHGASCTQKKKEALVERKLRCCSRSRHLSKVSAMFSNTQSGQNILGLHYPAAQREVTCAHFPRPPLEPFY